MVRLIARRGAIAALLFALVASIAAPARAADDKTLLVFAAASMKTALDDIIAGYGRLQGVRVIASYAASSALARQIEQGAEADLFISADLDWMDYVEQRKLIKPETRINLLRNRIALVGPTGAKPVTIDARLNLPALLGTDGRLAMGTVTSVPAGKYGKAALEKLGLWAGVESRLAQAENVRAALALVARGEAPLGIVYTTDAAAEPGVVVLGTFPEDSHPPIVYPAAVTASSKKPAAAAFLAHLRGPSAGGAFRKQGFTVVGPSGS